MANDEHVALLKKSVVAWNAWREKNTTIRPDLHGADLRKADLAGADLNGADLHRADLRTNLNGADLHGAILISASFNGANLNGADLHGADLLLASLPWANLNEADLHGANLNGANLGGANLNGANLNGADLTRADLRGADLTKADLRGACLQEANLGEANLTRANLYIADLGRARLTKANLGEATLRAAMLTKAELGEASLIRADLNGAGLMNADLRGADLTNAVLRGADLEHATLVDTILSGADLTGCRIYGISAWSLKLEGAIQQNLVITPKGEPEVTVDNIDVAQFIYLLLHNPKIRDVIDTIGRKAVLILGRFTPERKAVLDALREELRKHDYVPILFDFDKPASQDLTATVSTLAHLARFIIADLTDPSSIPYELATVVPTTPIPVQPILRSGSSEFAMFRDLRQRHHWVLPIHRYGTPEQLIAKLAKKVIAPAEKKVEALQKRRRKIEAELTKPR